MIIFRRNIMQIEVLTPSILDRFVQNLRNTVQVLRLINAFYIFILIAFYVPQNHAKNVPNQNLINNTHVIKTAFNEDLYILNSTARLQLMKATQSVLELCQSVVAPTINDELACQWPVQVNEILLKYDLLSKKVSNTEWARSARLSSKPVAMSESFIGGLSPQIYDIVETLQYLHLTAALTKGTQALRESMKSLAWQLNAAINPTLINLELIETESIFFQAWIQSEEPLGFLKNLSTLDEKYLDILKTASICLNENEDESGFKLLEANLLKSTHRLIFKEVDLNRTSWGNVQPGILIEDVNTSEINSVNIQGVFDRILNTDISFIGAELDPCRALSWTMSVLGASNDKINTDRLKCEKAKLNNEPLVLELPQGYSIIQKSILLAAIYKGLGSISLVNKRRTVSLYRSLETIQNFSGKCLDEDRRLFMPLIKSLNKYNKI